MFYTCMLSLGCQVAPNHPPCITVPPRPTYLVLEPPWDNSMTTFTLQLINVKLENRNMNLVTCYCISVAKYAITHAFLFFCCTYRPTATVLCIDKLEL